MQHRLFALERAADSAVVTVEMSSDLVQAVPMDAVGSCNRSVLGGEDVREGTTQRLKLSARHLGQRAVAAELQGEELSAAYALAADGRLVESRRDEVAVARLRKAAG